MRQAWWLIDQLVQQGVTQFCIAPGSRSTPLVQAATQHVQAQTVVHFDERGLAFYALGFGKGRRAPAAIICTSGTAVGNLLPAVMEASHSEIPLILLTADRPHELRACGANQTTDQIHLFPNRLLWQIDLSCDLEEKEIRSIGAQAFFHAMGRPQGPVQINCPYREPLYTETAPLPQGKPISLSFPQLTAPPFTTAASRGVISIGKLDDPKPILQLAQKLRWPIFADLLSQARSTPTAEQVRHFDFLLSAPFTPDFLLHFGEPMTSKRFLSWSQRIPSLHVNPSPFLKDPSRSLSFRVQSDIEPFCQSFQAGSEPGWLELWQQKDEEMDAKIEAHFESPFTEAHLHRSLPEDRPLFFGNGMPIRDANHFFFPKKPTPIFGNRGLSGIDGNIATAAGLSDSLQRPLAALIGDQAALHDLNSLPLLKNRPVLLIISNNFGGGIFEHLAIAKSPFFETHFAASHSWDFRSAAQMFDLPYLASHEPPSVWPSSGIVEIFTDRKANFTFQQKFLACSSFSMAF